MRNMISLQLPKSASNSSRTSALGSTLELLVLLGLGVAAVLVHAALRDRLGLPPGYQGTVWIGLLLVGRVSSQKRWASTLSAFGASGTAMLPMLGFGDPFRWLTYLAAGVTVDVAYWLVTRWHNALWFLVLLGGVAHATKPLLRLPISELTGIPYGSLLLGVGYPTVTHFFFGALGAFIGLSSLYVIRRRKQQNRSQ